MCIYDISIPSSGKSRVIIHIQRKFDGILILFFVSSILPHLIFLFNASFFSFSSFFSVFSPFSSSPNSLI